MCKFFSLMEDHKRVLNHGCTLDASDSMVKVHGTVPKR